MCNIKQQNLETEYLQNMYYHIVIFFLTMKVKYVYIKIK